jgi:hypothetical protein
MSTIDSTDEELLAMEISFAELTNKFTQEGFSPYACAAIMTKIAFMIYKSSMTPEDYNLMIDEISNSRDAIMTFAEFEQKGLLN